ncbi:MAG TPA: glycosyltransferase family 2 protein [Candidatus Paceibacterota bacterium]|jgi:hypothetical protein
MAEVGLHIGRAADLSGRAHVLYRALEILPATLSWGTLLSVVLLSVYAPAWAAYLIIAFSLYWLLKTVYLSIHLRHNWKRLLHNMELDWGERLSHLKHEHLWHLVILPFYKESLETVECSLAALEKTTGNKKRIMVVLAAEERAGEEAKKIADTLVGRYKSTFGHMLVTVHPSGVPGEMPGKGSNISYAAVEARRLLLDRLGIPYGDIIVSAFDVDTVVYPKYFQCITWHFLTVEDPYRASFQPVPLYNNNIWEAPALARVVAVSSSFWQMIQQERPEKLATFSSHAVSFLALHRAGYWQRNMVSEDSRIFWNLFFANGGNYQVIPIAYPISMDANFTSSFWQTMINIYRQHRRWTWGVENVPYIIYQSLRNQTIPLRKRLRAIAVQVEGFWSLATHPLILLLLGWLPIVLGNRAFHVTVLSYNLPIAARTILTVAMVGLIISAAISLTLLPPRPGHYGKPRVIAQVLQWLLVPITMVVFSAIPGLESQTRLALGRYLGFWVTPKSVASGKQVRHEIAELTTHRVT